MTDKTDAEINMDQQMRQELGALRLAVETSIKKLSVAEALARLRLLDAEAHSRILEELEHLTTTINDARVQRNKLWNNNWETVARLRQLELEKAQMSLRDPAVEHNFIAEMVMWHLMTDCDTGEKARELALKEWRVGVLGEVVP